MLSGAPASLRVAFLGASAAAHALAFVTIGHAPPSARPAEREIAVLVADPAEASLVEPTERESASKPPASPPPPTHTHPYPVPPDHDAVPHDPSLVHLPIPARATHRIPSATPQEPPAVVSAPPSSAPARFVMSVGAATAPHGDTSTSTGAADAPLPGSDAAPFAESEVSSPARLLGSIAPAYPLEAAAQEIESNVVVSIVVTTTGAVADAQIVKRAGYGFDEAVLRAVRSARFVPARRGAQPVAVRMRVTVSFALR